MTYHEITNNPGTDHFENSNIEVDGETSENLNLNQFVQNNL